jgi:hypothetical protein
MKTIVKELFMSYETPGLNWSADRLIPAFQSVQYLTIYDLREAGPDIQLAATVCAGLVNRPRPSVYLVFNQHDLDWLQHLPPSLPQTLDASRGAAVLDALLDQHRAQIEGMIIYDPALPDTLNVATTLAGQRAGLVVSPTLAEALGAKYALPLLLDLRTFGWTKRVEAYTWALDNLLEGSSGRFLAGMHPTIMGCLRSFLVATRSFTCWLDTTALCPLPGATGGSERALAQRLFRAFAPGSLYLGWLVDEPSGVALLSQEGIPVLASDYAHNLEVWTSLQPSAPPVVSRVRENSVPVVAQPDTIYLSFTLSDGDNLQYCQHQMFDLWRDSARGTLPIGWTISPFLPQAAPVLADYYQRTMTPNDELIAGPTGAGYIFPVHWPDQSLPAFLRRTGELMQAMDLSTLMVLDSGFLAGTGIPYLSKLSLSAMALIRESQRQQFAQSLAPYGVRGILTGVGFPFDTTGHWRMAQGLPIYYNLGLIQTVERLTTLLQAAKCKPRPLFLNFYVEAWRLGPAELKQVVEQLGPEYEVVLPRTLLTMLKG